jgi:hypothetical protein
MQVTTITENNGVRTYQVQIKFTESMLESEDIIQDSLNDLGTAATKDLLETFDADGTPIVMGSEKWTSKGKTLKEYQTPYGVATVERHTYQSKRGGKTFCPLEQKARIVTTSTPRFAKQISHKFAENASTQVQEDMRENHNRDVARSYLQNVADAVGAAVQAREEAWSYAPPALDKPVHKVGVGLDGTCMLLCEDGYRETMVGTIALYDKAGERQHTTYIAASPEYGKATFKSKLDRLIKEMQDRYPSAKFIGIADGAKENWTFLEKYTDSNTLDFWHATEYLTKASHVLYPRKRKDREAWLEEKCHELKHKQGAATRIMKEVQDFIENNKVSKAQQTKADTFLTYFTNNKQRMNYGYKLKNNEPIGSGVTEAACKVIVKQRLCKSGAKWKDRGARAILSLRALRYSKTYWGQFWTKVGQYGFPVAA